MISKSRVIAVVAAVVALVALFALTVPHAHATRFGVSVQVDTQASDDAALTATGDAAFHTESTTATTIGDIYFADPEARHANGAGNAWPPSDDESDPDDRAATPVPLPPSVWLLASGLLVSTGAHFVRRRS